MIKTVLTSTQPEFIWIDVTGPTREELEKLAGKYGLHWTSVQDCLDPEHLPKFERYGDTTFLIARAYDDQCPKDADSIQALTRKVAIFFGKNFLITIHRKEMGFLDRLKARVWGTPGVSDVLLTLLQDVLFSFEKPLEAIELAIDRFEASLFGRGSQMEVLQEIYLTKRKVGMYKRLLWHTKDVVQKLDPPSDRIAPQFQDLRENVESLFFFTDELLEDVTNLLNIQIALASHRTNEIVRVLTVFSVFFLPLTFIVGVYGMNFRHMPELGSPYGYPLVWVVMIAVVVAIGLWFRHRGWLK